MKNTYLAILLFSSNLTGCDANNLPLEIVDEQEHTSETKQQRVSKDVEVITCEPDYQPINYCTEKYTKILNQEAKLPVNFDRNKRIVTTKLEMKEAKKTGESKSNIIYNRYFIVIDLDKKIATPLEQQLTNFSNSNGYLSDIEPQVLFDKNSNKICFTGSLIGYGNTYPNIDNACFKYDDSNGYGYTLPVNTPFEERNIKQINNNDQLNNDQEYDAQKKVIMQETSLPITLSNYTSCNSENNFVFCEKRFPTYSNVEIPNSLAKAYVDIKYIDNIIKLPNINDIEVYIFARNMTDIEEYTLITFSDKIIDKLLIGKVGSVDDSDRRFSINENYENIEITDDHKSETYTINSEGKILKL